jgi:hypothetical protein
MKKKKNTFLAELVLSLIIFIGALFTYLFSLNEIKTLSKEKDTLEGQLLLKADRKEVLLVELEKFSAEDRIVKIAEDSLSLVKSLNDYEKLFLDESQVNRVNRILTDKYE